MSIETLGSGCLCDPEDVNFIAPEGADISQTPANTSEGETNTTNLSASFAPLSRRMDTEAPNYGFIDPETLIFVPPKQTSLNEALSGILENNSIEICMGTGRE